MIITADWVLPVSRPPIRHGAVVVEHGLITAVGRAHDLRRLDQGQHRDFPGCVLLPGLVNAHTHLSLSSLGGLLPPAPFENWISRLVTAIQSWDVDDHAASASLGATRCLQAGVTVVGDITYGPEAPGAAADAGLGGVFYWELLGSTAPRMFADLERMEFPGNDTGSCGPRIRCGLSPHSVYTSGPRLIAAMREAAIELRVPMAIHIAESAAEVQLVRDGTGPLAPIASRQADGFTPPGCGPIAYLDHLGALDGVTAIHAGHAAPSDIARLAAAVRGVVACPRSNTYLSNPIAPVARLIRAGIPVGLGTDSAASNYDLDLMEEVRALHAHDPSLTAKRLIELVTAMGAIAIGVEDRFGVLEPGLQGDLAAFEVGDTDDPESDFVRFASAETLRGVLTAGVWRVLDGQLTEPIDPVETRAHAAQIRAEHALSKS